MGLCGPRRAACSRLCEMTDKEAKAQEGDSKVRILAPGVCATQTHRPSKVLATHSWAKGSDDSQLGLRSWQNMLCSCQRVPGTRLAQG